MCQDTHKMNICFNRKEYYSILSPEGFPDFLLKYTKLPILSRLSGVGLLCGTDWTPLYHNRFFYSRLDHSIGVALVLWHFTNDRKQTLAGLLHDVSTPAFSHVSDFRNGDTLTQESTENANSHMVRTDTKLSQLLEQDELSSSQVADYHQYPLADNDVPHLSADRLEYMFPSGMVLDGCWNMDEIATAYGDLVLCRNEYGLPEPGFRTVEIAADYCRRCCGVGLILQRNENKVTLQLLAEIITCAVSAGIIRESDCFLLNEKQLLQRFTAAAERPGTEQERVFARYYHTFRTMTAITCTDSPLSDHFCVSLDVKKRYINPLAVTGPCTDGLYESRRVTGLSFEAETAVCNFLSYRDTPYGCVRLANC